MRPRAVLLVVVMFCAVPSAWGLDFVFNASSDVTQDVMNAFNAAAARWEANLTDNITVRVDLGMGALDGNALAVTSTNQVSYSYSKVKGWLAAEPNQSADDVSAIAHLPAGSTFNMLINRTSDNPNGSGSLVTYLDNDGSANNKTIAVARAELKAMGAPITQFGSDASITVNTGTFWDYNPRDGVSGVDLVGVAMHELGHVLGFASGVAYLEGTPQLENDLAVVTPLDLFRFSAESVANGVGTIDWSTDKRDKYFSIDGGTTKIASFSTGVNYGDGYQTGHWKDALGIGIMDPTIYYNEVARATATDRRAFDVLGYTLNNTFNWLSGTSGNWGDTLNWNTDVTPYAGITAVFDQAQTYTVTVGSSGVAAAMRIRNGAVTLALSGGDLGIDGDIRVGDTAGPASVALTMSGTHALSAGAMYVGGNDTAAVVPAVVTIGAGSRLNVTGALRVWAGSSVNAAGGISAGTIINSGSFTSSGSIAVGASFTNLGGSASIGGTQAWAEGAGLHVSGGTVDLNSDAGAGGQTLAVDVGAGARVNFNASQHLKSLAIIDGEAGLSDANLLVTKTLSMTAGGTLDLRSGAMVVLADSGSASAALADITGRIGSARNSAPLPWQGTGITSSAAGGDGTQLTSLGAILNRDGQGKAIYSVFEGEAVDANSVLVKYTLNGDADLNGTVDGSDYFQIDRGFLLRNDLDPSKVLHGWYNGDFNYDDTIDGSDYFLIDKAFLSHRVLIQDPPTGLSAMGLAVVPEPGGVVLLVIAGAMLRRRRR